MAVTKKTNLVIPEVMGPAIEAKLLAGLKLLPYAKVDNTLVGGEGDKVTIPVWAYSGDAVEVAEGETCPTSALNATKREYAVKKSMKAFPITDEAADSAHGDPIAQAEHQIGLSIRSKIDQDLVNACYESTVYVNKSTAKIGYDEIVAGATAFDSEGNPDKVIFIHPQQEGDILLDEYFMDRSKFGEAVGVEGVIGKIAGCFVKKSKRVFKVLYEKNSEGTLTVVADDTAEPTSSQVKLSVAQAGCMDTLAVNDKVNAVTPYWVNPIVAIGEGDEDTEDPTAALTIFLKRDVKIEAQRNALNQTTTVVGSKYYIAALTNAGKVVLLKVKA